MRIRTLPATVALVGFMAGASPALAIPIQARIPLVFVVDGKVLPPADYVVDVASSDGPSVLEIRMVDSGERVMFDTDQIPEGSHPKEIELVFDKVGDKTYLAEVWGVVDSGRAVRQIVDGQFVERAEDPSRRHITAIRVVDGRAVPD